MVRRVREKITPSYPQPSPPPAFSNGEGTSSVLRKEEFSGRSRSPSTYGDVTIRGRRRGDGRKKDTSILTLD